MLRMICRCYLLTRAKRAARESGIKLMVHIGDTLKRYDPNVIRSLLPLFDEGDILTYLDDLRYGRRATSGRSRRVPPENVVTLSGTRAADATVAQRWARQR